MAQLPNAQENIDRSYAASEQRLLGDLACCFSLDKVINGRAGLLYLQVHCSIWM
jgi:hypothetical protein